MPVVVFENAGWLSTVSVNVAEPPPAPLADMPTLTVPSTVAPSAGFVNDAVSVALRTVITRTGGLGSVPPWLSVTVSET